MVQFGVCLKNGIGIHLQAKLTEAGAGFGGIVFLQLPKLYISAVFLFFSVQIVIGNITEERNAATQANRTT